MRLRTRRETSENMTPIQLWLPRIHGGIASPRLRSDMHRMFRAWTREHVMWSVPGWNGPKNWHKNEMCFGCVNGENYECTRILLVSKKGTVIGFGAADFPNISVNGLLDAWLNFRSVDWVPCDRDEWIDEIVPRRVDGGVTHVKARLRLAYGNVLPFTQVGPDQKAVAQWPPTPTSPSVVSPELESALAEPHDAPPTGTIPIRIAWPSPFEALLPLISFLDDLFARDQMRMIAEMSGSNLSDARAQATNLAQDWLSEGRATRGRVWLTPIVHEEGEQGALFAIESQFGVSISSLDEVRKNKSLCEKLEQPTPVQRVWGLPGLMWALLINRLNASLSFRHCQRCGRLISGKANKIFCSEEDNCECYRKRKRDDKRRSRIRNVARPRI